MTVLCKTRGIIGGGICPYVIVGGALCGMQSGTCAHEEIVSGPRCAKCGGEVCTVSPGGPGKLIECMKCLECGWSVSA